MPAAVLFGAISLAACALLADSAWTVLVRRHPLAQEWPSVAAFPIAMGAAFVAAWYAGWAMPRLIVRYGAVMTVTAFGLAAATTVYLPHDPTPHAWIRAAAAGSPWFLLAWMAWRHTRRQATTDQHGA